MHFLFEGFIIYIYIYIYELHSWFYFEWEKQLKKYIEKGRKRKGKTDGGAKAGLQVANSNNSEKK